MFDRMIRKGYAGNSKWWISTNKGTKIMNVVEKQGFSRLHLSLIDMSAASGRMYGGFGMAVDAYRVLATAAPSNKLHVNTSGCFSSRKRENLLLAIQRAEKRGLPTNCDLTVHSDIPQHIGMGSSTQAILTALDAISELNHWNVAPNEIAEMSGRGRTSYIGIATHYCGGLCIDAGQKYSDGLKFLPSNVPGERKPSLFIGSWEFPNDWIISLIGTDCNPVLSTKDEKEFMSSHTPLERSEGLETISILYHGILPSVISADYSTFALSLREINLVGWNKVERMLQPQNNLDALTELWKMGFAAGLSSFGPTIAVISFADQLNAIQRIADHYSLSYQGPYKVIPKSNHTGKGEIAGK